MTENKNIASAIAMTSEYFKSEGIRNLLNKVTTTYADIGDSKIYSGKHCGSDAEHEGAKYIYNMLKEMNIDVELLPFKTTKFQFNNAEIIVDSDIKTIKPYACLCPGTDKNGITAQVVDVEKGEKTFYENHDILNKIALIETKEDFEDGTIVGAFQMYEAEKNGAVGIILYTNEYIYDGDTIRATYSPFKCNVPVVTISYNDAMKIKEHIKETPEKEIKMAVDAVLSVNSGTSYDVIGEIKGQSDEHILYSCHLDHFFYGIQDNVSSVATLIGIAKAIKESGYTPQYNIDFLFTASHEIGKLNSAAPDLLGAWEFVHNLKKEWQDKIIVDINFEYGGLNTNKLRTLKSYEMRKLYSDFLRYMPKEVPGMGEVTDESSANDYYLLTWTDCCPFIMSGIPVINNDTVHEQIYEEKSPYMGRDHSNMDNMDIYSIDANMGSVYWYGCLGVYIDSLKVLVTDYTDRAELLKLTEGEKQFLEYEKIDYGRYEKQMEIFNYLSSIITKRLIEYNEKIDVNKEDALRINSQILKVQRILADCSDGLTTAVPSMISVPHKVYIEKGLIFRIVEEEIDSIGYDTAYNKYLKSIDAVGLEEKFSSDQVLKIKSYILGENSTWNENKCKNYFTKSDLTENNWKKSANKNIDTIEETLEYEVTCLSDINKIFIDLCFDLNSSASENEMMRWIEEFTQFPHRKTGTKEGKKSAEFVRSIFEDLGLTDSIIEEIPSVCWECATYRLDVNGQDVPCFPANGTNRRAETGYFESSREISEIAYLGGGSEADFNNEKVKGKVVLCDIYFKESNTAEMLDWCEGAELYDPKGLTKKTLNKYDIYMPNNWPYNYERAMENGAVGFIGILQNYMDCRYYHEDYKDIVHFDSYMELPAVWISKQDGEMLKKRIKSESLNGCLDVRTTYEIKQARVVSAKLKGASDEIAIIHSHHDAFCKGAVQDASGMSVVFALADFFVKMPSKLRNKTLMFLSTDSHFTDYEGQAGFIRKRRKSGDKIIYDFAIEHIAKEMELDKDNNIILHDEPETRMLYVDKKESGLLDLVKDAVKKFDLEKTVILPVGKSGGSYTRDDVCSDAYDFNAEGIPVVSLVAGPMYLFHYSDDIDKVHKNSLTKVLKAYAYIIINCCIK